MRICKTLSSHESGLIPLKDKNNIGLVLVPKAAYRVGVFGEWLNKVGETPAEEIMVQPSNRLGR